MKGSHSSGASHMAPGSPGSPLSAVSAVSTLSGHPTPQASSALICLVASTWQRIFELQCQTAVGAVASRHRQSGRSGLPDVQPGLRYALGVLEICRHSSESMFGLLRAQVRGEHAELEALSEAALRDFAMTSSDAAQAARDARDAMMTGIQTTSIFPMSTE